MKDFKFYDRIAGWGAFVVALVCYLLTVEPTASWWDCGEFIATAVKLEVGHPPGAPLWMIIGRVAALFASDDAHMALMMNCTACLAAAFTSLFLFWSITHIARRIVERRSYKAKSVDSYTMGETIAIVGSGMVGALIYTFCDTAWFSAVEAEVYSMSSLFTAVVFWLILKWEEHADEKYSNRWLILICYLMGLSIGVHLLNLLVIPAIVLVYYYKKYSNTDTKGTLLALLVSVLILAFVLYFIIPQTVNIGARFDLFFVNVLGMPYYSGIITFLLLVMGGLGYWAWTSQAKGKVMQNTIALAVFMIMLGYTSFAMTVIRSFSNPPINENQPSDGFSLLSYLNREQYGDTPLLYGPYFTADVVDSENEYTWIPDNGKYLKIPKPSPKYKYSKEDCGFFPRMHSQQSHHIKVYQQWADLKNTTDCPSTYENLKFFVTYQMGHMYWRYFMWNFCGRQSDEQNGAGSYIKGNWITGIDFIDNLKGAGSENLPERYANNHGRNVYYMLPLLLGLLGLFIHFKYDNKNGFVVLMFFLLTGVAIVVYLNQTPIQPRERDYAFAGSFYAFSIWCGLGLLWLWDFLKENFFEKKSAVAASVACVSLVVPVQMAYQNWDDHDRSGRYTCRDFATNYLESCAPNAILFTFGDNDTFPLWYAQEVEGVRRDVRVVNLSLAGCDWYIKQSQEKKYNSEPVPMTLDASKYRQDKRNIVIVSEVADAFQDSKYSLHKDEIDPIYSQLYNEIVDGLSRTSFPAKYPKDFEDLKKGYESHSPVAFRNFLSRLMNPKVASTIFGDDMTPINLLSAKMDEVIKRINAYPAPISSVMSIVGDDQQVYPTQSGNYNFIASRKIEIPVNKQNCLDNGTLDERTISRAGSSIRWDIPKNYFTKSDLVVMDILAANNWKRPVYFASSGQRGDYLGLDRYMRLEGFAYRIVPYVTDSPATGEIGAVDSRIMYDNMMNKFAWGRMNEDDVVIEENNRRQIGIMDIRGTFARLATQLVDDGEKDKAQEVLKKCLELVPSHKVPYDYTMLPVITALYHSGMKTEAEAVVAQMTDEYKAISDWLAGLAADGMVEGGELRFVASILGMLSRECEENGSKELMEKTLEYYSQAAGLLQRYNLLRGDN